MLDNGYASALNSAALGAVGIQRDTPQPPDGKIIKDERGEPTGLILGARRLVAKLLARRTFTATLLPSDFGLSRSRRVQILGRALRGPRIVSGDGLYGAS